MKVSLKALTPNAEVTIVEIARVSSPRIDKTEEPEKLINYLIRNKHWSPFEHASMTFEVVTSKAIAIQYLRHVSLRFQEFSQRYAEVTDVEPIEFRLQAEQNRQSSTDIIGSISQGMGNNFYIDDKNTSNPQYLNWMHDVTQALEVIMRLYSEGIKMGIAKECARMILPMATQTTLFMTGNVRSWIHLLDVRDDGHAQKEAQLVAKEIKKLFIKEFPIISKARNYESQ